MEITNMLCLSTCHIKNKTDQLMKNHLINDVVYYPKIESGNCYGYFIFADSILGSDVPEDLIQCIEFARTNGCDWINMDCDGDPIKELKNYWED